MKGIILGDSHVGSLKAALNCYGTPAGFTAVQFYAAPSTSLGDLKIHHGKLVPENDRLANMLLYTSGGTREIVFDDADVIILHGLGLSISVLSRILERCTIALCGRNAKTYISLSCLKQAIADNLLNRISIKILSMVREVTNKPILLSQTPFPDESIRGANDKRWGFMENEDRSKLHDCFVRASSTMAANFDAIFVPQPHSTIVDGLYTAAYYSKGSEGIIVDKKHADSDFGHMNAHYGNLVLHDAVSMINDI
jgi:hypothetical protein